MNERAREMILRAAAQPCPSIEPGQLVKFAEPLSEDEAKQMFLVRESFQDTPGFSNAYVSCHAFPAMGWMVEPIFSHRAREMRVVGQMASIR